MNRKYLILIAALIATAASTTAIAGKYDGASWGTASNNVQVINYDPVRCEVCRAENGQATMTECNSPSAMQAGLPYVIYCGGGVWGEAGSAPGTTRVGPGGHVGSFRAGQKDYWTVKQ